MFWGGAASECVYVQVVMSAVWGGGMLGVAYYLVDTGHLYIMPDAAEREDFGLLRRGKASCLATELIFASFS